MCTKHQRKRNLNENQECKIKMFCYFNQVTCFYLKIYNFFTDQNLFNNLLMVNTVNQNQYAIFVTYSWKKTALKIWATLRSWVINKSNIRSTLSFIAIDYYFRKEKYPYTHRFSNSSICLHFYTELFFSKRLK